MLDSILIIGKSGMVGSNIDFGLFSSHNEFDITNLESMQKFVSDKKITGILHLAATNLRESEEFPQKAIDVNVIGTINVCSLAKQLNIPLIYISSGAVFSSDIEDSIFDENSIPKPTTIYGKTKYAGEKIVSLYSKSLIVRTGWLFGGTQSTHNKFVETTINTFIMKKQIRASTNFWGSPTYVKDLIQELKNLIITNKTGILHIVNSDYGTGYDIAEEIANIMNISHDMIIQTKSNNVPNAGPYRGKTEKLTSHTYRLRNWREALREYVFDYTKMDSQNLVTFKQENIWSRRTKCRLCNATKLYEFISLPATPPANHFVKQRNKQECIPLSVSKCSKCNHFQLMQKIDSVFLFSNYPYISSTSFTMTKHLKDSIMNIVYKLNILKTDTILEFGSNDGTCLNELYENKYLNILGIDPAENILNTYYNKNISVICDFFGKESLDKIYKYYNKFKLIYAFHCCAHIEDIRSVFETVNIVLEDTGYFVFEVGYFLDVFNKKTFDVIYHEHIDYHTVTAMTKFAKNMNFTIHNVEKYDIQGGSIRFYLQKKHNDEEIFESVQKQIEIEKSINLFDESKLSSWSFSIKQIGFDIKNILIGLKNANSIIVGYGAPAKVTTFLYTFEISTNLIEYIIDDNPLKQNMFTPGLHIPIKSLNNIYSNKVNYIIVFAWNFADEIIQKLQFFRDKGGRIIVPYPEIKIV